MYASYCVGVCIYHNRKDNDSQTVLDGNDNKDKRCAKLTSYSMLFNCNNHQKQHVDARIVRYLIPPQHSPWKISCNDPFIGDGFLSIMARRARLYMIGPYHVMGWNDI